MQDNRRRDNMRGDRRRRPDLTAEQVKKRLAMENGPELLMKDAEQALRPALELYKDGYAPAAAFLWRCGRIKKLADRIDAFLGEDRAALYAGLKSDFPKLRQNSARLISYIGKEQDLAPLMDALNKEETRFVRPAMLLSIGAVGGERAKAFLESYKVAPAASPEEQPHVKEEQYALSTALKSFLTFEKHTFTKLPMACEIELKAPDKLAEGLAVSLPPLATVLLRCISPACASTPTTWRTFSRHAALPKLLSRYPPTPTPIPRGSP